MKNYLKFFCALLIGVLSAGFVACGDDDEPDSPEAAASIIGTWRGYSEMQNPTKDAMTAKFYEDGTCEIWWYNNPLLCSYYFRGDYTISKKKLKLVGLWCDQGDRPSREYDQTVDYSIKNGVLSFKFDLAIRYLTKDE